MRRILLIFLCLCASADDWPQFRGPGRDGVWNEKDALTAFPDGKLEVRWRKAIGPGWSSPVVSGGRVFVNDSLIEPPKKATERLRCFDAASGDELWTHSYEVTYPDWAISPAPGRGPTSTPLIHDGKVYTLGNRGDFRCLNTKNGELVWKRNLETEYDVQDFAFSCSPLVDGTLLIVTIGSFPREKKAWVLALDKDSGKEVWKAPNAGLTNSSPIIVNAGGKRQLIVWTQMNILSLDPQTGAEFWHEATQRIEAASAISMPVVRGENLLVGGMLLKLYADKAAAKLIWPEAPAPSKRVLSNTSAGVILGEHVYSAKSSGEFVCLDLKTGAEIWATDKATDKRGGASVGITLNGDGAYLHTDKGDLVRVKLAADGYQEISRAVLLKPTGKEKTWQAPAFANGCVFARNDEELVCEWLIQNHKR